MTENTACPEPRSKDHLKKMQKKQMKAELSRETRRQNHERLLELAVALWQRLVAGDATTCSSILEYDDLPRCSAKLLNTGDLFSRAEDATEAFLGLLATRAVFVA